MQQSHLAGVTVEIVELKPAIAAELARRELDRVLQDAAERRLQMERLIQHAAVAAKE
jgi:hypothetical protein